MSVFINRIPCIRLVGVFASLCIILILLTATVFAGSVKIVTESDVRIETERDARFAAEKTQKFFADFLAMTLDRDVKVVIVADRDAYIDANIREYNISDSEAERRARTSRGWSQGFVIIQNAGDATLVDNSAERIMNIAHELVHQYQTQVSGGRHNQLEWLSEGSANAIAAKILELEKLQTIAEYRAQRNRTIGQASDYPSLTELDRPANWYAALRKYGTRVTYRVADIAVLELLKKHNYRDLFLFFNKIKTNDPDESFLAVFKMSLRDFAVETEQVLFEETGE